MTPVYRGQPVGSATWGVCDNDTSVATEATPVDGFVGTIYYAGDQVGTTQMEFAVNAWPIQRSEFAPFGQELTSQDFTRNRFKFTGKERDTESGLDYFGARYYSSGMGRWMSPDWSDSNDPIPYADIGDPQSLNIYSYASNNPLFSADEDGHQATPAGVCANPIFCWFKHLGQDFGGPGTDNRQAPIASPLSTVNVAPISEGAHFVSVSDSMSTRAFNNPTVNRTMYEAQDFFSGAGNVLSLGLTKTFNTYTGAEANVNHNSRAYHIGTYTGVGIGVVDILAGGATAAAVADGKTGAYFGRGTRTMFNGRPGGAPVRFGWGWNQRLGPAGKDIIRLGIGPARGAQWWSHITFWIP